MDKKTKKKEGLKILFLYTELAGYTLACFKALEAHVDELHIVRWPVNKEAPFNFSFSEKTKVYERNDYSAETLLHLAHSIQPQLVYCSGWIDKAYLKVCKAFKGKIPTVVGFDNQWNGSIKQHLASWSSSWTIQPYFSHAWIPGKPQRQFAEKLGFKTDHILTGVYSADTDLFDNYRKNALPTKNMQFPHRFLYVGRYVEWKGIQEMFQAFKMLGEDRKDWELWCVGVGDLYDQRPEIEGLKHLGFVQPNDFQNVINQTGVFVLPSKFEPWGVVLHEYARAAYTIIAGKNVGAASAFVEEGVNGLLVDPNQTTSLLEAFKTIINKKDEDLVEMGHKSYQKSLKIDPQQWAQQIIELAG